MADGSREPRCSLLQTCGHLRPLATAATGGLTPLRTDVPPFTLGAR